MKRARFADSLPRTRRYVSSTGWESFSSKCWLPASRRTWWRPVRSCPRSTTASLITRGVMSDPPLSPMLLPELLNFSEENILEIPWQVPKFSSSAPVSSLHISRLPRRWLDEARNSGGGMKGDLRTLQISLRPTPWIFPWSMPPVI